MSDDRPALRRIAWRELFPWLMILRAFRLAVSLPVLFLASLGTLLTPVGSGVASRLFDGTNTAPPAILALPAVDFPLLNWRHMSDTHPEELVSHALRTNVCGVYWLFAQPLAELLDRNVTVREVAHGSFVGLWNLVVWALFAGAITRIAVVRLGRDERVGLRESLRYTLQHYGWNVAAPLFPLAGVVACVVPVAILGLCMRFDLGVVFGGLLWLLALLAGLAITVFLAGLTLGWPLMWPAISCEESGDAFEAFSRSYSYTLQRPLNYLFYATLSIGFGLLCWLFVWALASATIETTYWAASWGAGSARVEQIAAGPNGQTGLLWLGTLLVRCGVLVVRIGATGFNHAFFWCAASAIYLCLRRDVDRTEFEEVFVADEENRYQLSSLQVATTPTSDTVASSSTGIGAESPSDSAPEKPSDVN